MITNKLTQKEIFLGAFYLAFSLLLIPILLVLGNMLLPAPLDDAYVNLIYFALNFVAVCCIFLRQLKDAFAGIGQNLRRIATAAITGFVVYFVCSTIIGIAIQLLLPDFVNLNDASIQEQTQAHFGVMVLGTVFLVPTAEELFHRCLVFGSIWHKCPVLAYIVSTTLFCLIHVAGYIGVYEPAMLLTSFIQYIPAGLCLAWAYRKADSILAPILLHTAVNAIGILSMR